MRLMNKAFLVWIPPLLLRCQLLGWGWEASQKKTDQLIQLVAGDAEGGHQSVPTSVQEHHSPHQQQSQDEQHHAEHRQLTASTSVPREDHFHQAHHPDHQHRNAEGKYM